MTEPQAPQDAPALTGRTLLALVAGQVGMHAAMAGMRMAFALQALREGLGAWMVGLLLALFAAAAVLLALRSGRLVDRLGYHRPVYLATAMVVTAALIAVASTFVDGALHFLMLCAAAMLAGSGANMGMLAIQHTAGLQARDSTERVRVFSWLGVAPSFSNVVGPVAAGLMIDLGGFAAAYALLLVLPLVSLWSARQVPRREAPAAARPPGDRPPAWTLLGVPGMRRLLFVSWLISTGWDVHSFAVPILGHEFGFSASTIGLVLGVFTLSVTLVRLVIPLVAHRVDEVTVVSATMVGTALVFALYPFAHSPWTMGALAALLGITLGSSQPMVLSTLHHLTPDNRHGEALAFRSMTINMSSTAMPLVFGAAGAAIGAGVLFWIVGALIGAGAWPARGLRAVAAGGSGRAREGLNAGSPGSPGSPGGPTVPPAA